MDRQVSRHIDTHIICKEDKERERETEGGRQRGRVKRDKDIESFLIPGH